MKNGKHIWEAAKSYISQLASLDLPVYYWGIILTVRYIIHHNKCLDGYGEMLTADCKLFSKQRKRNIKSKKQLLENFTINST